MKISIITVCYNSEATIAQTLQSVAGQCWTDYEHIVVDGASKDGTMDVVRAHENNRLRWVSAVDKGIYDAMNKGLALATGDYVAFLNSDDLYARTNVIRLVAERAVATDADCIMGDVQFFDDDPAHPKGRFYTSKRFSRWKMKLGIMPPHPALFVKRSLLNEAGGFDTSYRIAADFDLVARIILRNQASWSALGQTITLFRSGGISTQGGFMREELTREFARSLQALSVRLPRARILLRYPIKAMQYIPFKAASRNPI